MATSKHILQYSHDGGRSWHKHKSYAPVDALSWLSYYRRVSPTPKWRVVDGDGNVISG